MKTTSLLSASLLSLSLGLGACAAQDDQELTQEEYDDIAMGLGALVATPGGGGEAGSMSDAAATASSNSLAGVAPAEGASSTEIIVRAGLEYEYRVDCFDIADVLLDTCSELTDRADVSVSWSGELDTPNYEGSIVRTGEWSLSGLTTATATLEGTGSFDVSSSFMAIYRPVVRELELSYDAVYEGVQIDTAEDTVVGGTIHYSVQGSRFVERGDNTRSVDFSVDAEVTFSADGVATLVIDRTRSYEIDLSTGVVVSVEAEASNG